MDNFNSNPFATTKNIKILTSIIFIDLKRKANGDNEDNIGQFRSVQ